MEEDFFLKKMRGVKPFNKDNQSTIVKNKKKDKTTTTNKTPRIINK